MATENDYTAMQKSVYEDETPRMAVENHKQHNSNPDYWDILLKPLKQGDWSNKTVLDFGCGCGRNVENVLNRFDVKEVHGCDISSNNIEYCKTYVLENTKKSNFKFFVSDGQTLQPAESDAYDLIFSTIVLQHIPVYTIRKKILTDFYRCTKPGGTVSFQMGGAGLPHYASYYDNVFDASGTNGHHDVSVTDPQNLVDDLTEIGFKNIECVVRQSWEDAGHSEWVFVTCTK